MAPVAENSPTAERVPIVSEKRPLPLGHYIQNQQDRSETNDVDCHRQTEAETERETEGETVRMNKDRSPRLTAAAASAAAAAAATAAVADVAAVEHVFAMASLFPAPSLCRPDGYVKRRILPCAVRATDVRSAAAGVRECISSLLLIPLHGLSFSVVSPVFLCMYLCMYVSVYVCMYV